MRLKFASTPPYYLFLVFLCLACQPQSNQLTNGTRASCALEGASSSVNPATAADIIAGKEAWSNVGAKLTGTLTNHGNLDVASSWPGAGYFGDAPTNIPDPAQICGGTGVLGVEGTANCGVINALLLNSNAHRDRNTVPILQTSEAKAPYAGADLPAGYREIPVLAKDNDGYVSAGVTTSEIVPVKRGTNLWQPGVSRKVCGKGINSSIEAKIADCVTKHPWRLDWDAGVAGRISWDGAKNGNAGQGSWTLVTVYSSSLANGATCDASCREIWRDDRTGLLWSSKVAADSSENWCRAAGNIEAGDPANFCNSTNYQPARASAAESACAETDGATVVAISGWCSNGFFYLSAAGCTGAGGSWTASSDNYNPGTPAYGSAKGGMGRYSALSVRWRLPTKYDYELADLNGIRFVLPAMADTAGTQEWTATAYATGTSYAWAFHGSSGSVTPVLRSSSAAVRCVGR